MKFFQHLKGDLFGGLTAGVVALPLALAFGVQSGLGAIAGLYGAIFIGFFASLFGGTNTQISGPTAPMTAVSMVIIAGIIQLNEGSLENALPAILAIFLMAGLMQIGLGALKLGKYIKYIPYPVVSGFMTGIGVIILLTQVLPAIGYYPDQDQTYVDSFNPLAQEVLLNEILSDEAGENLLVLDNFEATVLRAQQITPQQITTESRTLAKKNSSGVVGAIKTMPRAFQNIDITELSIALITILIIFGFKRITTTIPSTLIALLGVTLGVFFLDVDARKLGEIPSGFPLPNLEIFTEFNFGQVSPYLFSALTLALLGAIDSLLTSVVADNMTKTRHDPNKELLGQGIGNSIASIFGGIPGAGATIRTVVNINSGGKTRLSGMVGAVLLLIIVLALGSYASEIPSAVLAGILITVGIGVMDYKGLKVIRHIPKSDVIIMFTVLILTVTWDLVYAVGIGLVIASLIFMKKMGDANAAKSKIKTLSRKEDYGNEDYSLIPLDLREEVFIKELDGPLFFGSTKDFQSMSQNVPDRATHVIIRMERVPFMDQSGLFAFEEVARSLVVKEIIPLLVGLKEQPKYRLEAIDIIPDLIKKEHLFETYTDCVDWVNLNVENVIDHDGNAVVKP